MTLFYIEKSFERFLSYPGRFWRKQMIATEQDHPFNDTLATIRKAIKDCPKHHLYPLSDGVRITAMKCKDCPYRKEVTP